MKTYQEMAESVFRKGDIILEKRRKRRKAIMYSALSVSGLCAAVALFMNFSSSESLKNDVFDNNTAEITDMEKTDDNFLPDELSYPDKDNTGSDDNINNYPPKKNENKEKNDLRSDEDSVLTDKSKETPVVTEYQKPVSETERPDEKDREETKNNEAEKEDDQLIKETLPEVPPSGSDVVRPGRPSDEEVSDMKQLSAKRLIAFAAAMSLTAGPDFTISYAAVNKTADYDKLDILAHIEDNAENYDFDNNGTVNIFDAYALNIFINNREALPAEYAQKVVKYGDINSDGSVDMKDSDIFTPYCCFYTDPDICYEYTDFEYGTSEDSMSFKNVLRFSYDYMADHIDKYEHHRFSLFSDSIASGSIDIDINNDNTADLYDLYDIWLFDTFYNTEFWTKIGLTDGDRERIEEKCTELYKKAEKYVVQGMKCYRFIAQYIITNSDITVRDLDVSIYSDVYGILTYKCEENEIIVEHNVCEEFTQDISGDILFFLDIPLDYEEDPEIVSSDDFIFKKYSDHAVVETCKSCSDTVSIPSEIDGVKVTEIGDHAFNKHSYLENIIIPDTVTRIGGWAFAKTSLRSIYIPDGVKIIETHAFENCEYLEEISGAVNVESLGEAPFNNTPWLEEQKKQNCFVCLNGVLTDVSACSDSEIVIPDGVKAIGTAVFFGNSNITSVVIPDSVTSISSAAFGLCKNLEKLVIPDSVTHLGESIIEYDEKLETVNIPAGLTEISSLTFYASGLRSAVIPEGVTVIGENAFRDSRCLKDISIPDTVTAIGTDAFLNTVWLDDRRAEDPLVMFKNLIVDGRTCTGNVIIPDGVEKINGYTFAMSTATSIFVPDTVRRIETRAFSGVDDLKILRLPEHPDYIGYDIIGTSPLCEITYVSREEYDNGSYFATSNKAEYVKSSDNSGICGDIDMNGSTDLSDLTLLSMFLLRDADLSDTQAANADVDHDGNISLADLARLKQYVTKDIDTID